MDVILDRVEMQQIMEILESMEDEQEATRLLRELNDCTKELGHWILNQDPNCSHEEWLKNCQDSKARVDALLVEIRRKQ